MQVNISSYLINKIQYKYANNNLEMTNSIHNIFLILVKEIQLFRHISSLKVA